MSGDREEEDKGEEERRKMSASSGVTRRGFMKSVGLGGAAIGLASVASATMAEEEGGAKGKTIPKAGGKKLKLTVAFAENPRVLPLKEGIVEPEHIELQFETISANNLFYRNLKEGMATDVSEMSLSETLLARERKDMFGKGRWDWTPIPIFLSRGFSWVDLYVSNASGIKGFEDLKGKRIGVPDYCMTGALWIKIGLKDLYGIEARDNVWTNGRSKDVSQGGMLGLEGDYGITQGVTLHWLPIDQTLDMLLDRGELDAIAPPNTSMGVTVGNPAVLDRYGGTKLTNNPKIRRLFDDGGQAMVLEYFRKTRCHQPNHHVIIRDELLAQHPWVAMELYEAFKRSKEVAYERAKKTRGTFLYFEAVELRRQSAVLGEDPFPLGVKAMKKTIERAIHGSLEQGLIRKPVKVEDLYFRTTLDT